MSKHVTNIIALVITTVWAISFIADIAMKSYEPSPYMHAIMMTVAGAAFANSFTGKEKDGPSERPRRRVEEEEQI